MIDHLGLDVSDVAASLEFYRRALAPLGYEVVVDGKNEAGGRVVLFGIGGVPRFVIAEDKAPGVGAHVAFQAETRDQVHAFHAAALAAGGRDNGAPGPRPNYGPNYYAAFVLDPDGMNVEAVCRAAES